MINAAKFSKCKTTGTFSYTKAIVGPKSIYGIADKISG